MTLSKTFILISLSFSSQLLHAHSNSDSLYIHYKDSQLLNRTARPTLQVNARESFRKEFSYMGIPFIASGLIVKKETVTSVHYATGFNQLFHLRYDDYTQYVPLAATWGLKLAGLEGRSSWKELTVSNVFSAALMAGFVNALKYTTKETRPDNSSNNSFHPDTQPLPLCVPPSFIRNTDDQSLV